MPNTVAAATVRRSRLRSTTVEPPSWVFMPPPNMSDRPPPRPACRRMNRIRVSEAITSMTISSGIIGQSSEGRQLGPAECISGRGGPSP
jgi:hypothetical protein